jgi:hypothetical protein
MVVFGNLEENPVNDIFRGRKPDGDTRKSIKNGFLGGYFSGFLGYPLPGQAVLKVPPGKPAIYRFFGPLPDFSQKSKKCKFCTFFSNFDTNFFRGGSKNGGPMRVKNGVFISRR